MTPFLNHVTLFSQMEVVASKGVYMPEISRFLGIVIAMYFKEHTPPHFHAKSEEIGRPFPFKICA